MDGQQRLTTIYIILLALYKKLFTLYCHAENERIRDYSKQAYTDIAKKLGLSYETYDGVNDEQVKLQLLESDQALLHKCIEYVQSSEEMKLPYSNRKFMKAHKTAEDFLDDLETGSEKIALILQELKKLAEVELEDSIFKEALKNRCMKVMQS